MIYARCGCRVPQTQEVRRNRKDRARQCTEAFSIHVRMIEIPQIAHRRMAVTDMTAMRVRQNPLGRTGFGTQHQVVSPQIELLQRKRIERQHVAVPATAAWYFLQERNLY